MNNKILNVLVFDDSEPVRARKSAEAFKAAGANASWWYQNKYYTPEGVAASQSAFYDCVALHARNEPSFNQAKITTDTVIKYTGDGPTDGGIGRAMESKTPLTIAEAKSIVEVCSLFGRDQRSEQFKRIWSGVPELLISWLLWKHYLPNQTGMAFNDSEVAEAYSQLRASVLLRSGIETKDVPSACAKDVAPSIEQAKLLINLARVDL